MEQEQVPDDQKQLSSLVARFKDFLGVEEVSDPSETEAVLYGGYVGSESEIQEVSNLSETEDVIHGGLVTDRSIAITILLLWIAWSLVGLIEYLTIGSTTLLVLLQALMGDPLRQALRYYLSNE